MDSFKFLDFATRKAMKAWADREPKRPPIWTPLNKPLPEARIALISSAAHQDTIGSCGNGQWTSAAVRLAIEESSHPRYTMRGHHDWHPRAARVAESYCERRGCAMNCSAISTASGFTSVDENVIAALPSDMFRR